MESGNYSEPQDGRARQRYAANTYPPHISRDGRGVDIAGNAPTPNQALRAVELNQAITGELHDVVSELETRLMAVLRSPNSADTAKPTRTPAFSPLVELLEQHAEGLLSVRNRLRDLLSRVDL